MEGFDQPYRGFPYVDFVQLMDNLKKTGKNMMSGLYHSTLKRNKLIFLTLIPAFWVFRDACWTAIYSVWRQLERYKIKPLRYSQPIRELHRVFSGEREKESPEDKEYRFMVRDVFCMFTEFDNAYRFRLQDLMDDFNVIDFRKNPFKELKRIIAIAKERENYQDGKDRWILLETVFLNYLKFDKRLKKIIFDAFSQINTEEMTLKKEDMPYCKGRKDYTFKFMNEQLMKL
jgi:hypothetical protein